MLERYAHRDGKHYLEIDQCVRDEFAELRSEEAKDTVDNFCREILALLPIMKMYRSKVFFRHV